MGADGEPLTPDEFLVLFQIYELTEDLFVLFGDLAASVGLIILLGILFQTGTNPTPFQARA